MIAEVNWDNFEAKFNPNKQAAFERLCYLLFCKEHNKSTGISRFKNHAGIETDPIDEDGAVIGWQAKFYTTRLSEHEEEFRDAVDVAKQRHPALTKVVFYTNQDFGQDAKKTDPPYKTRIEEHAASRGVELEWRTASYFQSPFVCEENVSIAQYFFSLQKGVLESIRAIALHTEAVLKQIHSEINFGAQTIRLDRTAVVARTKETLKSCPLLILSGGAGVGKTAVVKDFYQAIGEEAPLFVFKASQFNNLSHVDELLTSFGEITLSEFIKEHEDISAKYIVIDSAEKVADIENQDALQIFLSALLDAGWGIIFTVRYSYLDDLRSQLKEIYHISFQTLDVPNLSPDELAKMSGDFSFELPRNDRLRELLQVPLYLNEYLQNYPDVQHDISYADFRELLWRKHIQRSMYQKNNLHVRREECFLRIALARANSGSFFVKADGFDQEALARLNNDGIVERDPSVGGYFITHDVYEEWALDKIIERSLRSAQDIPSFYQTIGDSLPIRRAFRSWLSDKLLVNDDPAKSLIAFTVGDSQMARHWKDEVLVSVLLSDYSDVFFEHFEEELLRAPEKRGAHDESSSKLVRAVSVGYSYEERLLHKILFLLRIACKSIDEEFLRLLGLAKTDGVALRSIFTVPRGRGWNSAIAFVNKHRTQLKFTYMDAIIPVLEEWNRKNREGETTKHAAQMALFYFEELTKRENFYWGSRDETKNKLIATILNGSHELKAELHGIVDEVIATRDTSHRGRYYELIKAVLSSASESAEIAKNLPEDVIRLANLFWFHTAEPEGYSDHRLDLEQYFDLAPDHHEYYPASALQTPVFPLLRAAPKETVDFILSFTNRAVEYFAKSEFAKFEAQEVTVPLDDQASVVTQYICHRIWNLYRGTQTAPPLLESVHMALEKWLLSVARSAAPEILQEWCLYLIRNSRSASIAAIVASVVLAEPSKLFSVARVLFRTKEFFFFDQARLQLDMSAKSLYSMSHDPLGLFKNERLETCDDKHRGRSLEHQALQYQLFRDEGEDEEIAKIRQETLWKIFDDYYAQLPDRTNETDSDKSWRLCLARMDRRKMKITTETKDNRLLLNFNPEIDADLRKHSEDALAKNSEAMKYIPLKLWSQYRFERNEGEYKKYPQYDNNYRLVVAETKEVIEGLQADRSEDRSFTLFYHSVPPYTCAVLIRDHPTQLSAEEKDFCKTTLLSYASLPLESDYRYQAGDGVVAAINVLPLLLRVFLRDSKRIKEMLLLLLFNEDSVGMNQRLADYAVSAVLEHLWRESPVDANSIVAGYVLLKPQFDNLLKGVIKENRTKGEYGVSQAAVVGRLRAGFEAEISAVVANQCGFADMSNVTRLDPGTLITAFLLLPLGTKDEFHRKFVREMCPVVAKSVKSDDRREDRLDYTLRHRFLEKLAYFVLSSPREDIEASLKPFVDGLGDSRQDADLFNEFVIAEDRLDQYEQFWTVWQYFYPPIVELCKRDHLRVYGTSVVHSYLLAGQLWKEDAQGWHSLKERGKAFFRKVAGDIGGNPAVLYSLAKVLNEIGREFADDGIFWISDILGSNSDLATKELEVNTVYYLENLVRRYILRSRRKARTTPHIKNQLLVVLNFLIEKGSVTAYLLREDIL
jgi:hypothetical protein